MTAAKSPPPPALLEGAALFLDFDGTLVELADAPDAINVPGHLPPLLGRLRERLAGRLAILSGRSLADLERHITLPGIAAAGSHGAEMRLAGAEGSAPPTPPGLRQAREEVSRFATGEAGLLVEDKPAGVALHYRLAPERAASVAAFMAGLGVRTGLAVLLGKMVAELRPHGANKGEALRRLMAEPPFAGARPVCVGDDLTDEDAFAAAAALGGAGVLVGTDRPSAAGYRLDDVSSVARWLAAAAGEADA